MSRGKPVAREALARAGAMLEDGASQREVTRTTGISRMTLRKYFPGQCWTFKDGGDFRALTKSAEVKIRRAA
ncbi:MAG: helix-turn-helix domain-containing protein [Actinomycetota bacterium]|nr:helix-turn-helix domain-containing protein [Actinomycetota bacterium]